MAQSEWATSIDTYFNSNALLFLITNEGESNMKFTFLAPLMGMLIVYNNAVANTNNYQDQYAPAKYKKYIHVTRGTKLCDTSDNPTPVGSWRRICGSKT
jgi:hypothetical protein